MTTTTVDTADRLRTSDLVQVDGKWALVLDITHAATPAHPARLAVTICDPNGALTDLDSPEVVHIDAGDTVTYRPHSTHLADATGRRPGEPTPNAAATRIAPSSYVVNTPRITRGTRFTAHGNTFEVVGDPITVGWNTVEARVREIGGTHDGNEFSAHLAAR